MKQVAIKSTVDSFFSTDTFKSMTSFSIVSIFCSISPTEKKVISLKGILKNVDITEEDIT